MLQKLDSTTENETNIHFNKAKYLQRANTITCNAKIKQNNHTDIQFECQAVTAANQSFRQVIKQYIFNSSSGDII